MQNPILFTNWGPTIGYDRGYLHVEDINPHWETKWKLSRWEMMMMGARLIIAAFRKREAAE